MSPAEFERRLKQREAAFVRKFASAKSNGVAVMQAASKASLRGARETLAALIDPCNAPPQRLPGGRPTFVNRLHHIEASLVAPASAPGLLTPNSGFGVVRRDPRCALIYSKYESAMAKTSIYELKNELGGTVDLKINDDGFVEPTVAGHVGGIDTHGDFVLPWVFEDGTPRLWFQNEPLPPATATSSVTATVHTPSITYSCDTSFLLNGVYTVVTVTALANGAGRCVFQLPAAPYVGFAAFRFYASPGAYERVDDVTLNDNSSMKVRFLALPQFWTNVQDIDALRVNAASIMFSDRTAENYSQGDIVAYQASGGDPFEKMLGANDATSSGMDPYSTVADFQDMFEGAYKKGRYIPLKPTENPRELEMINLADAGAPWEIPPIEFADQENYLFIGFNVGTLGAGVPSPIGKWTAYYGIEGECESQWRETAIPRYHPDVLKEAKWCFSQVKCNFENPSHLAKVWAWVKANAPHVLNAIDMIAPVLPPQFRAPAQVATTVGRTALALMP